MIGQGDDARSGVVALLVPDGLEDIAVDLLHECSQLDSQQTITAENCEEDSYQNPLPFTVKVLPQPDCPTGFKLGRAGSLATVLVHPPLLDANMDDDDDDDSLALLCNRRTLPTPSKSSWSLSERALKSPGVAAAMAVIAVVKVDADAASPHAILLTSTTTTTTTTSCGDKLLRHQRENARAENNNVSIQDDTNGERDPDGTFTRATTGSPSPVITAPRVHAALETLLAYHECHAKWANPLLPFQSPSKLANLSFRVATVRGGRHPNIASPKLSAAVADQLIDCASSLPLPGGQHSPAKDGCSPQSISHGNWSWAKWNVSMEAPDVVVFCLLQQDRLSIGFLLPPFSLRPSQSLPEVPREWFRTDMRRQRPHMNPARAACLVQLGILHRNRQKSKETKSSSDSRCNNDTNIDDDDDDEGVAFLDPCGGMGILAIEAAGLLLSPNTRSKIAVALVSLDNDPDACRLARINVEHASTLPPFSSIDPSLARTCTVTPTTSMPLMIDVILGDATTHTGIASNSVDLVVSDLPYGRQHTKLDVGMVLREMWRLVVPGGHVVLVGAALRGGLTCAVSRAAMGHMSPFTGAWRIVEARLLNIGGIMGRVVVLLRQDKGSTCYI